MSRTAINKTLIKQKIELLEKQSQFTRDELNDELEMSKSKIAEIGKITLGVGVGLILSAIVLKGFFSKEVKTENPYRRPKSSRVYQRFFDQLFSELSGQAFEFILKSAKKKLNSYNKNNENASD